MIKVEHLDYFNGQHEFILKFMIDDIQAGYITYSEYEGEPYIKMIDVKDQYRRMGIARRMMQHLQGLYDDIEINLGMLTDDGDKLISNLNTRKVENPMYEKVKKQLEKFKTILVRYQDISNQLETMTNDTKSKTMNMLKNWNTINDKIEILEEWLMNNKRYKILFI